MKISRDELKDIIKECIVEVLSEGLGSLAPALTEAKQRPQVARPGARAPQPAPLPARRQAPKAAELSTAVRSAIKESAGNDPIMASIFADTARTTLPTMIAGDHAGGAGVVGDRAQRIAAEVEPEQIVGKDVADRWASLAFETPRPQGGMLPPGD